MQDVLFHAPAEIDLDIINGRHKKAAKMNKNKKKVKREHTYKVEDSTISIQNLLINLSHDTLQAY